MSSLKKTIILTISVLYSLYDFIVESEKKRNRKNLGNHLNKSLTVPEIRIYLGSI